MWFGAAVRAFFRLGSSYNHEFTLRECEKRKALRRHQYLRGEGQRKQPRRRIKEVKKGWKNGRKTRQELAEVEATILSF